MIMNKGITTMVISNHFGYCLVHTTKKGLKTTIKNLQGHLEWIEKEDIEPPYLYMSYYKEAKGKEMEKIIDGYTTELKQLLKKELDNHETKF